MKKINYYRIVLEWEMLLENMGFEPRRERFIEDEPGSYIVEHDDVYGEYLTNLTVMDENYY